MQNLNIPMSSWQATGGTSVTPDEQGGLVFNDGTHTGPHVLRLSDPRLLGAMVQVTVKARPLPGCSTQLLVLHPRIGAVACHISAAGVVTEPGVASAVEVQRDDTGALTLSVTYYSTVADAAVGTAITSPFYTGTGQPQFAFDEISLSIAAPALPDASDRIVLVDVGAQDQVPVHWRRLMPRLAPVLLPCPTAETGALDEAAAAYPAGRVLQAALYNKKGRRKLNRAAAPARSSLLAVDRRTLRKFADPAPFEVLDQINVDCVRFDDLHASGTAPAPDAIRLDAQGTEYEVLQGFGNLLASCLVIQMRTAFYPVYKGQKLLGDVIALLDKFDFSLALLHPIAQHGQVVEAQAWFVKSPDWAAAQTPRTQERLAAIRPAMGLRG